VIPEAKKELPKSMVLRPESAKPRVGFDGHGKVLRKQNQAPALTGDLTAHLAKVSEIL